MSYFVYSSVLKKVLYFGEKKYDKWVYFSCQIYEEAIGKQKKYICDLTNELQVYRLKKTV